MNEKNKIYKYYMIILLSQINNQSFQKYDSLMFNLIIINRDMEIISKGLSKLLF